MRDLRKGIVRVLVVEDDTMYRLVLNKVFAKITNAQIVGIAATLEEARQRLLQGGVDLVTIDVVLGEESGLDLLPWMLTHARGVVAAVLTAGSKRDARQTVDALLLGASTLVLKPHGPTAETCLRTALVHIVDDVHRESTQSSQTQSPEPQRAPREVLAIGASTGGPVGVVRVLRDLPLSFDLPILIVQHMPTVHIPYYAELLARESGRPVHVGEHGMRLQRGHVYLAGGARHMELMRSGEHLTLALSDAPEEHFCRPAVDPLFRSVARACGDAAVGVVLSGMGRDGAIGAQQLHAAGAPVLVQDRASSVVWGMPGAVVAVQGASQVVGIDAMASAIMRWANL